MKPSSEIEAKLEALRQEYVSQLGERFDQIDTLWHRLHDVPWHQTTLEALFIEVHRLSGSGATFGFETLSRASVAVERIIKPWLELKDPPTAEQQARVGALIADLRLSVSLNTPGTSVRDHALTDLTTDRPAVFIVDSDPVAAADISVQLGNFDYEVDAFFDVSSAFEAVVNRQPQALLVDLALGGDAMAGIELLEDLAGEVDLSDVALYVMADRGDISARLAAARCNAETFYVKPLDVSMLVDRLNSVVRNATLEPYRVLIVDDDEMLAAHYGLVLEEAGMAPRVVADPLQVLDALAEHDSELVLLDINMPQCNGVELARVIRQLEQNVSLPIVYLSSETDLDQQFMALRMGGDEFLCKPISDYHLVTSVVTRAQRGRDLRALMSRDNLTGLLGHGPIKERLAAETARAGRAGGELSVVLLDLDDFKAVNDGYGYPSGDRVLRTLANLLRRRLRLSDWVGRYGGQVFALVLPECSLDNAVARLEKLKKSFAEISFRAPDAKFSVTFSAGVCANALGRSADELFDYANHALGQAKAEGRNTIRSVRLP